MPPQTTDDFKFAYLIYFYFFLALNDLDGELCTFKTPNYYLKDRYSFTKTTNTTRIFL